MDCHTKKLLQRRIYDPAALILSTPDSLLDSISCTLACKSNSQCCNHKYSYFHQLIKF